MSANMACEQEKEKPAKPNSEPLMAPPTTSNSTAASVTSKVLGLPELLENILSQRARADIEEAFNSEKDWNYRQVLKALPSKPLYTWQRVSRTWRNTIQGSTQLRQFMLLEPIDLHINGQKVPDSECNERALTKFFGPNYMSPNLPRHHNDLPHALYYMPTIHIHRLNAPVFAKHDNDANLSRKFDYPDASWKKIKLQASSPDLESFQIRQFVQRSFQDDLHEFATYGHFGYFVNLEAKEQVTLGDVMETIKSLLGRTWEQHRSKALVWVHSAALFNDSFFDGSGDEYRGLPSQDLNQYTQTLQIKRSST